MGNFVGENAVGDTVGKDHDGTRGGLIRSNASLGIFRIEPDLELKIFRMHIKYRLHPFDDLIQAGLRRRQIVLRGQAFSADAPQEIAQSLVVGIGYFGKTRLEQSERGGGFFGAELSDRGPKVH